VTNRLNDLFKASTQGSTNPAERIAKELTLMIRLQELNPGERLREQALADHFGVSRGPVREALNRLATSGLVHLIPGRGAELPRLEDSEVLINSQVTGMLMGLAARRAADTSTDTQKQAFAEALEALQEAVESGVSGRGFLHFSEQCLMTMTAAANSKSLVRLIDQVVCMGPAITWAALAVSTLPLRRQRLKQWARVLEAVQDNDGKRAEREALAIQKRDLKAALKITIS